MWRPLLKLSLCVHSRDWRWGDTMMLWATLQRTLVISGYLVIQAWWNSKETSGRRSSKCYFSRKWHSEWTRGCYGKEGNGENSSGGLWGTILHNNCWWEQGYLQEGAVVNYPAVRPSWYYTWKICWIYPCNWTQCNSTFQIYFCR